MSICYIVYIYSICYIVSTLDMSSFYTMHGGWGILVRVRMRFLFLARVCIRLIFRCEHVLLSVWGWLFLSSWAL
jgi:hypothetical protein